MNITQTVSVNDLIVALDGSVDAPFQQGTWVDAFADLLSNKFIDSDYYIDDFIENGQKNPICVMVNGCSEYNMSGWIVGNGNHRLALAVMLGWPTIDVLFTEQRGDFMQTYATDPANHYDGGYSEDDDE